MRWYYVKAVFTACSSAPECLKSFSQFLFRWELNNKSIHRNLCNICSSRLRNCTMLTVYNGDCVMVQVRWWQPSILPLAARRPERAWVKPTRATRSAQRQVTDLWSMCLFATAWTLCLALTLFFLKIDIKMLICTVHSSVITNLFDII